jgi:hypothetical protein
VQAQLPLYYVFKNVSGNIYEPGENKVEVKFISRRKLEVKNCSNPDLDTFLRTLTLSRTSRRYLEHLITSDAHMVVDVTNTVGIVRQKGKYHLAAGLTGSSDTQSNELIEDYGSNFEPLNKRKKPYWVFKENTIMIFKGSVNYYYSKFKLDTTNTFLYDLDSHRVFTRFIADTVPLEPIMHPDLMYTNMRELFYFAGTHEIFHTTPKNIDQQVNHEDPETDAYILERKLFLKRKRINAKKLKFAKR